MNNSKLHPLAVLGRADDPSGGLQGYCLTNYFTLVTLLGEPHTRRGDKVNVVWAFRCNNGTIFHVYDWKLSSVPQGDYDWHIGGNSPDALAAFERHTGLKTQALRLIPIDETSNQ